MRLMSALWSAMLALLIAVLPALGQQKAGASSSSPTASASASGAPSASGSPSGGAPAIAPSSSTAPPSSAPTAGAPAVSGSIKEPSLTPAASSAPAGSRTPSVAAATPLDGATYAVRLRDLEARVDELKEQIRRSHTRLSLLSDTILSGGIGGARAEITFKNELSGAFRVTRVLFVLDGAVQYNKQDDTGALSAQDQIPIFSGSVPPGDHTVQVLIQIRGHGYGVFSYLRGYKFEVKSSHSFTITEGKTIQLDAIAWEKGGVTTPLEQRPDVRYLEKIKSGVAAEEIVPKAGSSSGKANASGSFSAGAGTK